MRFIVTFRHALAEDSEEPPFGKELAEFLAAKLREQGLTVSVPENYEDYAWMLDVEGAQPTPWILVSAFGDGPGEGLVLINSGIWWLHRLLRRSDKDLRERIAKTIHAILSSDPRFSDIRWHVDEPWDEGWSSTPTAVGEQE
jgi:hypothetical protein